MSDACSEDGACELHTMTDVITLYGCAEQQPPNEVDVDCFVLLLRLPNDR